MPYVRNLGGIEPCGFDPSSLNNNDDNQLKYWNTKPILTNHFFPDLPRGTTGTCGIYTITYR